MTKTWLILFAVCLQVGCGAVQGIVDKMPKPRGTVKKAQLVDLSLQSVTVDFDIDVYNPYLVPLPLIDVSYSLASGDAPIVSGKADLSGVVPARGSKVITVPATVTFKQLLDTVKTMRPGAVIPFEASLDLIVDAPQLGQIKLPLKKKGKIPIPTTPAVRLTAVKWTKITLTSINAELTVELQNENDFPFELLDMDYSLSLADTSIISARVDQERSLKKEGVEKLVIPIKINPLSIGRAGVAMIRGEGSTYRMKGTMNVKTPFGQLDMPYDRKGNTIFLR